MKVMIFDTETTGLPKTKIINPDTLNKWPYIVQLSFIIFDTETNSIIDLNDSIIKMKKDISIPKESIEFHKITNEISNEKGISIESVINKFIINLNNCDLLVGHNITFDINMVKVEILRLIYEMYENKTEEDLQWYKYYLFKITNFKNTYCTIQESVNICNIKSIDKYGKEYVKFPKLIELHKTLFNTLPNNLHNSLNDILVTLRCFMMLKFNIDIYKICLSYQIISDNLGIFNFELLS